MALPRIETIVRRYNGTLAAGAIVSFEAYGDFIFLRSNTATDDTLKVSFDNNSETIVPVGVILKMRQPYSRVILRNTDSISATYVVLLGQGDIDYKALVLSGTIVTGPSQSATGTFAADLTGGAAAKVFSTTTVKSVLVHVDLAATGPLYLGFDNTVSATKKIMGINPGGSYEFTNFNGDIWAFGPLGTEKFSVSSW